MKISSVAVAVIALLLLTPVALAIEDIVLKSGESGMADVVETTENSIKIKYVVPEGPTATMTLKADQLDPYCFYNVRSRHMEATLENHLKLAKWCIENKLFSRAKIQIQKAREIDEGAVEEILNDPRVLEGIADRLLDAAEDELEKGDWEKAEEYVDLILTRAPETRAATRAEALLTAIESVREQRRREAAAAREKKAEEEKEEAAKAAAQERNKVLAPIEKDLEAGGKLAGQGLREKNGSRAKSAFEAAGQRFEAAAKKAAELRQKHGDHPDIDEIETFAKNEAIKCYINAGSIDNAKGSYSSAQKWGRRALAVDPDSAAAKSFLERVEAAAAMASSSRWR